VLLGEFQHSIDDKGRLKLPAKFADKFVDGAVIVNRFDGSLGLYTELEFPKVAAKYLEMDDFDAEQRAIRREVFASAENVYPDKGGRVVIPGKMRGVVSEGSDVTVTGNYTHLEIWPREIWNEYLAGAKQVKAKKTQEQSATKTANKV